MGESLLPYVSAGLASQLADRAGPIVEPEERYRTGIVLFADISGFSSLTERLADEGSSPDKIGEILSKALGSVVDAVTELDGDVMTFAGDAVLAMWDDDDIDNTLAQVLAAVDRANRALATAIDTPGHGLGLRSGAAMGQIWEAVIGGVDGEWHHLTAGDAVLGATTAVGLADPGELVAAGTLTRRLAGRATPRGEFARIDFASPPPSSTRKEHRPPADAPVDPFIPPLVREAVAGGHTEWIAELRRITMAFIRLDLFETSIVLGELHRAVRNAQATVNEYGGSVARVLYDDKGLVVVVRWTGLQATRDIAVSAVLAAMELQERIAEISIGIATGTAFVGQLGSQRRRDYTTIGHAVNRAARLMQTAHDEVLCDGGVRAAASHQVAFVGRGVMPLKGFQDPVAFYRPLGVHHANAPGDTPLVGRHAELRAIVASLTRLQTHGETSVITVLGEAGIGKTRLVQAALDRARAFGLRTISLTANQLTRSSPYAPWRPVFRSLTGLNQRASAAEVAERAAQLVGADRQALLPLLMAALGAEEQAGTEEGDADAARDLLSDLFQNLIGPGPSVLVLEDQQWMDSASLLLCEKLVRQRPGTAVVAIARPSSREATEQWSEFISTSPGPRLDLGPLTDSDALAVASQLLDVDFLPPPISDLISEKADGHPLFTEELVQSLRDQGVVRVIPEERRAELDRSALRSFIAPATLQDTVATRLDQLHMNELLTLKVASVLGREVEVDALVGIHPTSDSSVALAAELSRLAAVELLLPDREGFAFKHAVLRDVTYGLIPARQRRQLHGQAARWYSDRAGEGDVFILAEHWRQAEEFEKAVVAFERAGDLSLRTGSFPEAAGIFADTHEMAPRGATALQRARWKRKEAISHRGLGDLARTHALLVDALSELNLELPLGRSLATSIAHQGAVQVWHRFAPRPSTDARVSAQELEKAEIYFALGTTTFANLDALSLFYAGLSALNAAERAPESGVLALSQSFLMYVTGVLGLEKASKRYHERAEDIGRRIDDAIVKAEVLYNRAGFLGTVGDWEEAASLLTESLETYQDHANHRGVRSCTSLMAYHAHLTGRLDDEERLYVRLGELAERFDDSQMAVLADGWRSEVALRRGRPLDALRLTNTHVDSAGEIGDQAAVLKVLGARAIALLRTGDHGAARLVADDALSLIRSAQPFTAPYAYDGYLLAGRFWLEYDQHSPDGHLADEGLRAVARAMRSLRRGLTISEPALRWLEGHRQARTGSRRRAHRSWMKALVAAREFHMPFEEALVHLAIAEISHGDRQAEALRSASSLATATGARYLQERVAQRRSLS